MRLRDELIFGMLFFANLKLALMMLVNRIQRDEELLDEDIPEHPGGGEREV